jgi:hypothetical protein
MQLARFDAHLVLFGLNRVLLLRGSALGLTQGNVRACVAALIII